MPSNSSTDGTEDFQCVVCNSDSHGGDGWIFHTEDTKVVEITADGLRRELQDNARALCSIQCKEEFEDSDEYSISRKETNNTENTSPT